MAGETVREGVIPADGVLDVLRAIEVERTSGALRFEIDGAWQEVTLVAGQIALDQADADGTDPVETLLSARAGRYEVIQRLPPLPVSKGDTHVRTGSLAVHVPADLMAYCERAGLTGLLELVRDDERAEAVYDKGELTAIQFGGHLGGEVNSVFAWETGTFKIEALSTVPELDIELLPDSIPPPVMTADVVPSTRPARRDETRPVSRKGRRRRDETGQNFLKVVETTLGAIVAEAEKGRSPTRTSPPLPPIPAPRPESLPPSRPSREATVRIIYLTGDSIPMLPKASEVASTRHVRTDVTGEMMLPDATPERMRETVPERARAAAIAPAEDGAPVDSRTMGLALGALLVAVGAIAGMALLLLRAH